MKFVQKEWNTGVDSHQEEGDDILSMFSKAFEVFHVSIGQEVCYSFRVRFRSTYVAL
jgi:hypothetical protein